MKKIVAVLGSLTLVLVLTRGGFAAKGMLTGADIANGSLTGSGSREPRSGARRSFRAPSKEYGYR